MIYWVNIYAIVRKCIDNSRMPRNPDVFEYAKIVPESSPSLVTPLSLNPLATLYSLLPPLGQCCPRRQANFLQIASGQTTSSISYIGVGQLPLCLLRYETKTPSPCFTLDFFVKNFKRSFLKHFTSGGEYQDVCIPKR